MMMTPVKPDTDTLQRVKVAAIGKLIELGFAGPDEVSRLAALHYDDVLDRVFLHCSKIRVRVSDDRVLEIHPRRSLFH